MNAVTAQSYAAQGLTCFHQYQDRDLKTVSIDMLYTCLDSFHTKTSLSKNDESKNSNFINTAVGDIRRAYDFVSNICGDNVDIETKNNFEADVGLASSSCGFASLALAATELLGLDPAIPEVSKLARSGSFSAAASVSGGISIIRHAKSGIATFGEQIFSANDFPELTIVIALSTYNKQNYDFYKEAESSLIVDSVRKIVANTANEMISAFEKREIDRLAIMSERHAIFNYSVLHSGANNFLLWQPHSVAVMHAVKNLREKSGEPLFYSMNTGANVFIYCFSESAKLKICEILTELGINHRLSKISGSACLLKKQ